MTLINWSGAIFGAGSEWFWSMLQFVVVAITLAGIYFQLRQHRAANAFAQVACWRDRSIPPGSRRPGRGADQRVGCGKASFRVSTDGSPPSRNLRRCEL